MKKLLTSALALLTATAAYAADEVRLQLQWVTQAQFAGYYVALDKGIMTRKTWMFQFCQVALILLHRKFLLVVVRMRC